MCVVRGVSGRAFELWVGIQVLVFAVWVCVATEMGTPSGLVVLSTAPSDPLTPSEAAVLVERVVALVISPSEAQAVQ